MQYWQTLAMAWPKNYKAQRRTTQQRQRRLAPRISKTRHIPAARLRRKLRRSRAVKIASAMNRGAIRVRTALIHGSVASIQIIEAGDLAT
jgi:hypothetical protein